MLRLVVLFSLVLCNPGQGPAPATPRFSVVSVKLADPNAGGPFFIGTVDPGHFRVAGTDVSMMMSYAYGFYLKMPESHIVGLPAWASTQPFSVEAVIPPGARRSQVPEMLKALLADRFQLVAHMENRPMDAMALSVAPGGPKIKRDIECETAVDPPPDTLILHPDPNAPPACGKWQAKRESSGDSTNDVYTFHGVTMAQLATFAETPRLRVVDKTGLEGAYDFTLAVAMMSPNAIQGMSAGERQAYSDQIDHDRRAAYTKDLGLVLSKPEKLPVPVVVVDHIEKPTAN